MAKVQTAGVRLGKAVPGKSFPSAGKKVQYAGKIGGTGNQLGVVKSYAKGRK